MLVSGMGRVGFMLLIVSLVVSACQDGPSQQTVTTPSTPASTDISAIEKGEDAVQQKGPNAVNVKKATIDGILSKYNLAPATLAALRISLGDYVQEVENHNSSRSNKTFLIKGVGVSDSDVDLIFRTADTSKMARINGILSRYNLEPATLAALRSSLGDYVQEVVRRVEQQEQVRGLIKGAGVSDSDVDTILAVAIKEEGTLDSVAAAKPTPAAPAQAAPAPAAQPGAAVPQRQPSLGQVPAPPPPAANSTKKAEIGRILSKYNLAPAMLAALRSSLDDYAQEVENHNSSRSNKTFLIKGAGVNDSDVDTIFEIADSPKMAEISGILSKYNLAPATLAALRSSLGDYVQSAESHNASRSNVKLTMINAGVSDSDMDLILQASGDPVPGVCVGVPPPCRDN